MQSIRAAHAARRRKRRRTKTVFDFSHAGGSGAFSAEAASPTEVPLFYLLANTNEFIGARTPADVVAKNPKADVVIVSLWTPK